MLLVEGKVNEDGLHLEIEFQLTTFVQLTLVLFTLIICSLHSKKMYFFVLFLNIAPEHIIIME